MKAFISTHSLISDIGRCEAYSLERTLILLPSDSDLRQINWFHAGLSLLLSKASWSYGSNTERNMFAKTSGNKPTQMTLRMVLIRGKGWGTANKNEFVKEQTGFSLGFSVVSAWEIRFLGFCCCLLLFLYEREKREINPPLYFSVFWASGIR